MKHHPIPPRLAETIDKLLTSEEIAISVLDRDSMSKVIPYSNNDKISADFGGMKEFLENLFEKHKRIRVIEGKKNGSSHKPLPDGSYDLDLSNEQEKKELTPVATAQDYNPMLAGTLPQGLNAVQFYNAMDYDRVKREMDRLQILCDSQKETIDRMKEEQIKSQYSEAKASSNEKLLLGLAPHLVPLLAAKFAPGAGAASAAFDASGMAAPAVSHVKQQALQRLLLLNDDQAYTVALIMENIPKVEEIETELLKIIEKYELEKQE